MDKPRRFLLCDCGGSTTRALILSQDGSIVHQYESLDASNATVLGLDVSARTILSTVKKAGWTQSEPFTAAWMGVSGADDQATCDRLRDLILSHQPDLVHDRRDLLVTNDCDLLGAAVSLHGAQAGIALIAGTGSNAMAFRLSNMPARFLPIEACGRIGGWGHVLGDNGSAYWLGREALRSVLANRFDAHPAALDSYDFAETSANYEGMIIGEETYPGPSDAFVKDLLSLVGSQHVDDLLADVLTGTDEQVKTRIATISPLVTRYAEQAGKELQEENAFALSILQRAALYHARTARALQHHALKDIASKDMVLVLGGSLFHKCSFFATIVTNHCESAGFGRVVVVDDAIKLAGQALTKAWSKQG